MGNYGDTYVITFFNLNGTSNNYVRVPVIPYLMLIEEDSYVR